MNAPPLALADVSSPTLYRDDAWREPFAAMRRDDPVHRHPDSPYGPYWSVTRYADIMKVELDHATYSSASEMGGIQIADQPKGQELPNFIRMDPPRHTAQRKTVAPIVAPTNLANMEGLIRERTAAVLDGLPRNEAFDWVDRVSTELTALMLATLFDFPQAERRKLTHWSDVAIANIESADAVVKSEAERMAELTTMAETMAALWKERAAQPPKFDLISMMAHAEATRAMPMREFIGNFGLLIVGGNDTTRNTMSGIVHALDKFPDQRKLFEQDPSLIPNAVQECIRYQTPLAHMRRTATQDTELFGEQIRKGDRLILWYLSANRDEEVFETSDALDISRENARRHLSFGYGIHRCVGARLAEMQLRVLLEEMHQRRMRVHVAGDVERVRANFVHGFRKLEVEVTQF